MPAAPLGIKKVHLRGREGRNGKRTPSIVWEAKAYNPDTKRTEYVGRYATLQLAVDAKEHFEQTHARRRGSTSQRGTTIMTVEQLVKDCYLKRKTTLGRKRRDIKPSTIETNTHSLASFVAKFGNVRVARLDEDAVIAWCETQPGSVVEGVRAMFSWAVKNRLVKHNPMAFVESRRGEGRKDLFVISTHDLGRLVEAAQRCWPGVIGLRLAVLLELLAYSGMRPGEAFALRPKHLNFERRRICLDWQLDCHGDLQPLKNSRKREVVMDDIAATALQRLLVYVEGDDLLFRTATGRKFNSKSKWSYYWNPIRKSLGADFNDMDVYELRHYFATLMLDNDAREEDVAEQLGHSDGGELVRKLYGHPDKKLRLSRLEQIMRTRKRVIERRREALPPSADDLVDRRRDANAGGGRDIDASGESDSLAA